MCIFRFNPPAPACVSPHPCRKCHCVPRYWRLDVEAFEDYADSFAILEFSPTPGGSGCYWEHRYDSLQGTLDIRPRPENDFFAEVTDWTLGTRASLDIRPLSIDPNVVFEEWVVFRPDKVAYTRSPSVGLLDDPDFEFDSSQFYYFDCLGPNKLHYAASGGDFGGEDPNFNGWPPSLTVTPYYP